MHYEGSRRGPSEPLVVRKRDGRLLPLHTLVRNHSPTGFECGYSGSGPAQLALAILVDYRGKEYALSRYQRFKELVVTRLPREEDWTLSTEAVDLALEQIDQEMAH